MFSSNVAVDNAEKHSTKSSPKPINRSKSTKGDSKFLVNLADYVDTGLFLDHRITRQMVRDQAAGKNVLNLFAYTGSFTVYAAAGGAKRTVSVDLSRAYLDWAWQNMRLNGFAGNEHSFVASDVDEFVRNHAAGEMYDLVVFDPPTFSNSKRTERDWNVQTDAVPLLIELLPLVRKGGVIYFSSNFRRFKFDPGIDPRIASPRDLEANGSGRFSQPPNPSLLADRAVSFDRG